MKQHIINALISVSKHGLYKYAADKPVYGVPAEPLIRALKQPAYGTGTRPVKQGPDVSPSRLPRSSGSYSAQPTFRDALLGNNYNPNIDSAFNAPKMPLNYAVLDDLNRSPASMLPQIEFEYNYDTHRAEPKRTN